MLFSELYKTMVNNVTFLDFKVGDRPCLEGALVPEMRFFWQQCFFFTHASFRHVTSLRHQGVRGVF